MSAEMDALVAGATQKLEALEAALYGLKQVRGRFTTEDGMVSAEVNSDGALVALSLAETVTSLPPAEVAQLIIWACRQAAEDAAWAAVERRCRTERVVRARDADRHGHRWGQPG